MMQAFPTVQRSDRHWIMPGMATAHSHAFQRALRGRTQRRQTDAGSFWSWRGLMYELAKRLDAEDIFQISRFAYVELAMSGVTTVGEFHYIHHAPDGRPYHNRTELADAVICAAKEAGIRICLIRTAYMRGGYNQELESTQLRFSDPSTDLVLRDVDELRRQYAADPAVKVALAAHSIRAVPLPHVGEFAAYAAQQAMPFHMHVCEQRRELDECRSEYGTTPVQLLADTGVLSPRFVGVHATHLTPREIKALGDARASVCLCRTTERDLGDGLPETSALVAAGVGLCLGVDSHACADAFEEIRAVELDERSRLQVRHAVADAPALLTAATQAGYAACGLPDRWGEDTVYLKVDDASIAGGNEANVTDAIVFAATPRAVDKVVVDGRVVVRDGRHIRYEEAHLGYMRTLKKLGLLS